MSTALALERLKRIKRGPYTDCIFDAYAYDPEYQFHDDFATLFAENEALNLRITDLEAESARWKAARDECERQYQDKVRELNTLVDWQLLAADLAGALAEAFQHGEIMTSESRMNRCGAALHRYQTRETDR